MLGEAWLALKIPDLEANTTIPFFATHSREKKKNVRIFLLVPFTFRSSSSANRKSKSETRDGEPFRVVRTG